MRIAVVPGDGIGVDVTREAVKVLEEVCRRRSIPLEATHFPWSADHFLKTGETIPPGAFDDFSKNYDAIFMGAFGDPRVPDMKHAAAILLGARFQLTLRQLPPRCGAPRRPAFALEIPWRGRHRLPSSARTPRARTSGRAETLVWDADEVAVRKTSRAKGSSGSSVMPSNLPPRAGAARS
jgi:hypothetical protein